MAFCGDDLKKKIDVIVFCNEENSSTEPTSLGQSHFNNIQKNDDHEAFLNL